MQRLAWRSVLGAMRDVDLDDGAQANQGATVVVEILNGALEGRLLLGVIEDGAVLPAEPTMRPIPLSPAEPRVRVLGAVLGAGKAKG